MSHVCTVVGKEEGERESKWCVKKNFYYFFVVVVPSIIIIVLVVINKYNNYDAMCVYVYIKILLSVII